MSQYNSIEITDKDGWRKEYPLNKSITHIGCEPSNDIVLDSWRGIGISPRHAQLIISPGLAGYRLVNISTADILLGPASDRSLPPRSFAELNDGECIRLGDFKLVLHLGNSIPGNNGGSRTTGLIGLRLSLPQRELAPDRSLDGYVTVCNLGDRPGVQFKFELEGLDRNCYEMGPGPILFPGAEKQVMLRLFHPRAPQPPAGEHEIRVRAIAPEAYPGEHTVAAQRIYILPYYSFQLHLENVS